MGDRRSSFSKKPRGCADYRLDDAELAGPELIVALRDIEEHANMPIVMTARTEGDSRPDMTGATKTYQ